MAGPIVGSEGDSIECWENYSAGEVLVQGLAGQIHQQDVEAIVRAQKQMLQRFEKTNEMLSNCNALSASRYAAAHQEFGKHSSMLLQAKKDLDYIFKKIRNMKSKLETQYPHAVAAVSEKFQEEDEDSVEDAALREEGESAPPVTQHLLLRGGVSGGEGSSASGESSSGCGGGNTTKTSSVASGSSGAAQAGEASRTGGEEQVPAEETGVMDRDDEQAILSGKVKRISGKLHHISSSDSSTSSSTSSSADS